MKDLLPGDVVIVAKLDRLARSSRDSCLWARAGGIPRPLFGCLMMTIMGGIAEFERGLIRQRCEEGIERAKRNSLKHGIFEHVSYSFFSFISKMIRIFCNVFSAIFSSKRIPAFFFTYCKTKHFHFGGQDQ